MIINFTDREVQFLSNILIDRRQSSLSTSCPEQEIDTINELLLMLVFKEADYTTQDIGYLQYLMQEQNEIWGSRRSLGEKAGTVGPGQKFVPQATLILVKSISDKLGANLQVDITTRTDETVPRGEGSTWIMKNPVDKGIP